MEQTDYKMTLVGQSAETVKNSLDSMILMTQYNSRIILSNAELQSVLRQENSSQIDTQRVVSQYNSAWMTSLPFVDSLYIFDFYGHQYGLDIESFKTMQVDSIQETDWYEEVMEKKGYYCLVKNGDYFLDKKREKATISFLRTVNDINTFSPLGIMMVNIGEEAIADRYQPLTDRADIYFYVLDDKGELISSNAEIEYELLKQAEKVNSSQFSWKGSKYIFTQTVSETCGWEVIAVTSVEGDRTPFFLWMYMIIVLWFIICVFFFNFQFILIFFSKPIEKMAEIMNEQTGNLKKMEIKVPKGEMTLLRDTYNNMVERNAQLIENIYQEQKFKRKAELNALQEQIKPHFLYNTINALQYLALTGKNEILYDSLESFGSFYRMSLSKGKEIIYLREEVEIVRDYVKLQKLRYDGQVECEICIEKGLEEAEVLKMILQPLVENSIYHGILPKLQPGHIYIHIFQERDMIVFQVSDNGIGMTPEKLESIKRLSIENNKESFGLRGTLERIKIYYENNFWYQVESEYGKGTDIIIKIPDSRREECG